MMSLSAHAIGKPRLPAHLSAQGADTVSLATGLGVAVTPHAAAGNGMDFLVGRVSYSFEMTGPCVGINTACSSSLVAAHLAVTSMAASDCSSALVAGVFLVLLAGTMAGISQLQV